MPKCKFILKLAVQAAGCVFAYFCGGHKNNIRLQFRSSLNKFINVILCFLTINFEQGIKKIIIVLKIVF